MTSSSESNSSWLGQLPKSWGLKRAQFVLREKGEVSQSGSEQLLSISEYYGVKPRAESHSDDAFLTRASSLVGYKLVEAGDFAMNIMLAWKGAHGVSDHAGIVSPAYAVFEIDGRELHPPYAHHLFRSDIYRAEFRRRSTGIIDSRLRLYPDSFLSMPVVLPPLHKQVAIAKHLDGELSRIDRLTKQKIGLIDLLREWRVNVVREATTGLDKNGNRKKTGDAFTPTVPTTWSFVQIGRYASIGNGSTPLKDNPDFWEGGLFPWLNSSVVNGDDVREPSELVTDAALRQCHLPIVRAGSVIVALTGQGRTRGMAAVLRIDATINQHLAYVTTDPDVLDGEYLFWALTGLYQALRMVSDGQGGTKGALTCEELARFRVPLPSLEEQKSISNRLYKNVSRIDCLIHHVEGELALLEQLRSSTVTNAVLGRIDLTEFQSAIHVEEAA